MNKSIRKILQIAAAAALTVSFVACSSGQSTDTDSSSRSMGNMALDAANRALAELSYSPNREDGYGYKQTAFPASDQKYVGDVLKDPLQNALNQVGDGYVLQVTGHTDSTGPREAYAGKRGNIYYSTQRAKGVYDALITAGLPKERLTYKGVADDELLGGSVESDASENRRVTFKIVPEDQ